MHATLSPDSAISVAVRRNEWDRLWTAAGYQTAVARGEALGVHPSTASRLGNGELPPSAAMIARAILLLACRFEEIFEVTEVTP